MYIYIHHQKRYIYNRYIYHLQAPPSANSIFLKCGSFSLYGGRWVRRTGAHIFHFIMGLGHFGRGHLGRGHYGRGHLGRGHYGRGHFGRGHLGRGHFGPLIQRILYS